MLSGVVQIRLLMMDFVQILKQSNICQILLAVSYLFSGIALNLIQGALYFGLRPFNKYLFKKISYYLNYSLYSQLIFLTQYWADVRLTIHVNKSDYEKYYGKEHGYVIMNHTYEIDWLVGWMLCDNIGVLGNSKSYVKKSLQYLPTLGWAWKFGDCIFLERDWEKDKVIIRKQVTELVNYPDPMWLLLTAEGTRFTPEKLKYSNTFAEKKGLPVLKHHLTPRTKGFTTSLPYLRKNINAVYNVILGFRPNGVKPSMTNILLGKNIHANMYVQRIPMSEVPEDEDESARWLHDLYKKKDEMLDRYLTTGSWFEKSSQKEEYYSFVVPRRIYPLLNTLGWGTLVWPMVGYYMFRLFVSGTVGAFLTGCAIIACVSILVKNLIGQTKISKGSSYGIIAPANMANGSSRKQ